MSLVTVPAVGEKLLFRDNSATPATDGRAPGTHIVMGADQTVPSFVLPGNPFPVNVDNYARIISSNIMTRQANTTAYAAGQVIGGSATTGFDGGGTSLNGFTFTGFTRVAAGQGRIERIRLFTSVAALSGQFELRLFRGKPTITIADAGSFTTGVPVGNATATNRLIGRFSFDLSGGVAGSDGAEVAGVSVSGVPVLFSLPAGASDVFGILVAPVGYAPGIAQTFSFVAEGYAF